MTKTHSNTSDMSSSGCTIRLDAPVVLMMVGFFTVESPVIVAALLIVAELVVAVNDKEIFVFIYKITSPHLRSHTETITVVLYGRNNLKHALTSRLSCCTWCIAVCWECVLGCC